MEFWGEEVKPGMAVLCKADEGYVIHLSQAALGETKKASENVVVSVKVDSKKFVIGTLSAEKYPQIMCDLIFDKDFELSHNSKTATVFLCGYKSEIPGLYESDSGEDEDEELVTDKNPVKTNVLGVPVENGNNNKQGDEPSGEETFSGDEDDEISDDEDDEISSGTDGLSDDSEDESDEETSNKPEVGKKRGAETVLKTPASDKKAKIATPSAQKTGDKKGVHVATPHPAKQASKTPADKPAAKTPADKSAAKTPAGDKKSKEKSLKSGSHVCKSCSKTFTSDVGLQAHQKAKKHEA